MLYYRDIADIKRLFFDYQNPVWVLYTGKGTAGLPSGKAANNNLLLRQPEDDLDLGGSWQILETTLLGLAKTGGYGKLFIGTEAENIGVPIYLPHRGEQDNQAAGISGYMAGNVPPWNYLDMIAKERELWELRREIEDIKNANQGGFFERMIESMAETGQLQAIISGFISAFAKGGAPIMGGAPSPPEVEETGAGLGEDEIATEFVSRIRGSFSSTAEMREYLAKTAKMFASDPEGVKELLKNI